jgi:arginine deiminase
VSTLPTPTFPLLFYAVGVTVLDVKEILMMETNVDTRARIELEELAATRLTYILAENLDGSLENQEDRFYVGDKYKMQVIETMSSSQLVDLIMTNPTVHISPTQRDTHFTAAYSFKPLSNMVFTRDQQIVTKKGIVMCKLSSPQRQNEVELMKFCFKKLGFKIAGEIPEEGRLEGGDFFPAGVCAFITLSFLPFQSTLIYLYYVINVGKELALVGIGLRSNQAAVDHMLNNDLFGSRRVAVVKDVHEKSQDRMHLDCVFNLISDKCCLMYEPMMGEDSKVKRLVDEWAREGDKGPYKKVKEDVEFSKYMTELGYHIIPVTHDEQMKYGCNGLNLGNGNLICINRKFTILC